MVTPRRPDEDDDQREMNWLKASLVALVGASAGLIMLSGGASAVQIGIAVVGGSMVGALLLGYLLYVL